MAKLIYSLLTTALVQLANLGFGVAAARLLGTSDRGVLAYQVTLSTVIATLFSFGISEAVAYKATTKSETHPHTSYLVLSVIYGAFGCVAWLLLYPTATSITSADQYFAYLAFACYPLLNYGTLCFVAWFAGAGLTKAWNVQRLLVQLVQPLALGVLLLTCEPSITVFAFSIIGAHVLATAVGVWQLSLVVLVGKPRLTEMKELFLIGAQGFGSRLSNLVRDNADKLIVGTLVAPDILAQYVVAVSFAQLFNAYSQTIVQLYFSRIAGALNSKAFRIELRSATLIGLGAVVAIAMSTFAGKWLVSTIFGVKFELAGKMAPLLVIGMVFASVKALISAHALAIRQPWIASKVDVYAIVPTFALIFVSVKFAGVWGAAYAFIASQALTAAFAVSIFLAKMSELRRE